MPSHKSSRSSTKSALEIAAFPAAVRKLEEASAKRKGKSAQRKPLASQRKAHSPRRGHAEQTRQADAKSRTATISNDAPLLRKLANAEDEVTSNGFEIYEYRKPLGRTGRVSVPCDEAADPEKVRALLLRKNADLLYGVSDPQAIANVITSRPKDFWLNAAHVGWRTDPRAFVLQTRVIGGDKGPIKVHPPLWLNERQRTVIGQEGAGLPDWKERVAKPSQYSTRLMLLMSAAFAAPLLEIMNRQPFTLNLYGASKAGKTTGLLAATSIIGIGTESQLPNWNTTDSGFQETARVFNDLIMGANELALIKGGKKEAYSRIRQLTYWFSEGRDTSRNSASHYAIAAESSMWRGILVSTAENSFGSLARTAGIDRDPGEYARAHDVTATHSGHRTIFDIKPDEEMTNKEFRRWANNQLRQLREACSQNYGWAIDPAIEYLMKLGGRAADHVQTAMKDFRRSVDPLPKDGALRHAVDNFGLIFAGGCIAIETELVPWQRETLKHAIGSCLRSFLDEAAYQEGLASRAKSILKKACLKLPPIEKVKNVPIGELAGYQTETKRGTLYTIPSARIGQTLPDEAHVSAALKWLHATGALKQRKGAGGPNPDNKEWAETMPSHDGKNFRAIQFYMRRKG